MVWAKSKLLTLFGVFAVIFLLGGIFFLYFFQNKKLLDYGETSKVSEGLVLTNTTLIGKKDGEKLWEVHASKIKLDKDQTVALFEHIHKGTVFYHHKPLFFLTADAASYQNITKSLEVSGGIILRSANGLSLKCSRVQWNGILNRIKCPGLVEVTFPDGTMIGRDLTARGDLQNIEMRKVCLKARIEDNQILK